MLTGLEIHNFRGVSELFLGETSRVNLIVGRNDAGKTSVLESIRLLLTGDPRHLRRVNRNRIERRQVSAEQDYRLAFYRGRIGDGLNVMGTVAGQRFTAQANIAEAMGEETLPIDEVSDDDSAEVSESFLQPVYDIVVNVEAENGAHATIRQPLRGRELYLTRSQRRLTSPAFPAIPPLVWLGTNRSEAWAHARRYSNLYRMGGAPLLLDILKEIEPQLESLVVLTNQTDIGFSNAVLEVNIGLGTQLPLDSMGDGFSSTIAIVSAIGAAQNGICLIDEVENGIHYSLLPQIWRCVASAALSYDTQVWATTHSHDCINAIYQAFAETPDQLRVHRLERREDGVVAVHTFNHDMLGRALERGLEVR